MYGETTKCMVCVLHVDMSGHHKASKTKATALVPMYHCCRVNLTTFL